MKATEVRQQVTAAYREAGSARQMADAMLEVVRQDRADQLEAIRDQRERRRKNRAPESAVDAGARVERTIAAIVDRGLDDPAGVGDALASLRAVLREGEDRFARDLRASREYSWTDIAALLHVSRRTAINRWGHYPGGLPVGDDSDASGATTAPLEAAVAAVGGGTGPQPPVVVEGGDPEGGDPEGGDP